MIIESPFARLQIPEVALTPFLMRRAEKYGDKIAFIEAVTGRVLTYSQFFEAVQKTSAGLARLGFEQGDRFAICSPNCLEYAIAFHAVSFLGGTVTTMNPLCTPKELAGQLMDSGAKYLLTTPELYSKVTAATSITPVKSIFVTGSNTGAIPFESLQINSSPTEASIEPKQDVVALPYSSGTTGLPKGVMLTHYNIVANLLQIESASVVQEEDTLVCVLPLFHIYGMVVIMNESLYKGATTVFLPRFDMELLLSSIEKYHVTMAPLVPPILLALANHPSVDRYDLSSLKTIFSAAAPLSRELGLACIERTRCNLKQGYGMTEASPATHMTPEHVSNELIGTVGVCVANTECKIMNMEGMEAGHHEPGEIWVRGPQIMKGYLNKPGATAETLNEEGWLRTGDIGYANEDGYFFIVDRLKELIKYKGFQVAPAELESILLTHPEVADAAVVPFPDAEAGEIPKAFVVLKSDADADEIMKFVADRVAPYKKIRMLEFIDSIPKSPSGKILRRLLIQRDRSN
jgi:acyl-CoA synthetase (AMP-forming)/AMP-acid ligase II